jgi:hypothetical protein
VLVDHLSNKVDRSSHHGGLAVVDERIELPLGSENWIRGAGHAEPTSEFDAVDRIDSVADRPATSRHPCFG